MTKLTHLQEILTRRLPTINRWTAVIVSNWHDAPAAVKNVYPENTTMGYIYWNGKKSASNHNQHEIKEFPLTDIDRLIERNLERLRKERGGYK
jgi:hypothetical protein